MVTNWASRDNASAQIDVNVKSSSKCKPSLMVFIGDECDLDYGLGSLIFYIVYFDIVLQLVDLFGTGSNIINIVCFIRQGWMEPSNVFLLGLAISDMLSMATLIWNNVCLTPQFYQSDLPFHAQYISYPTAVVQHTAFSRVSCWTTAFITLERCLCVTFPLKIKRMMTPRRALTINISIFIILYCGCIAPFYYTTRFAMLPHPRKPNTTWLSVVFTDDQLIVERYSLAINNCFLPFSAFIIISVSTAVLVIKLKSKTKWRKKSTAPGKSNSLSTRDQSLSKMVLIISTIFITCYTPICLVFIGLIAFPEFSLSGDHENWTTVVLSSLYILESINASFNIFIYYKMSSKYRQTFRHIFFPKRERDQDKQLTKKK